MMGPEYGEPISSSGLHTYVIVPNASNARLLQHLGRDEPGEQPALHIRDTGTARDIPSNRNGRSATVPSSNTVSM